MPDREPLKVLSGSYKTPLPRRGDRAFCLYRDDTAPCRAPSWTLTYSTRSLGP